MGKPKRIRKKTGFADTKAYPHKQHPANYRKKGQDDIEYIVFTHHDIVEIDGKRYIPIPLEKNIDPSERNEKNKKKQHSYAYPVVFVGKRSALGKERKDLKFSENDKKKIDELFETLPKNVVPKTKSNKKSNK